MKKKIVKDINLRVDIVNSKRIFRANVDSNTRLKNVANQISKRFDFDPITTEYKFHFPDDDQIEIPLVYTMRQIEEYGGKFHLMAKIMSVDVVDVEKEPIHPKLKFYDYIKQKQRHIKTRTIGVQADKRAHADVKKIRFEELFSVGGYKRVQKDLDLIKFKRREQKKKKEEIWLKLENLYKHKIMRGVGLVGFCSNKNCHSYDKWVMTHLGFGQFRFDVIHSKIICEICPMKDMLPRPLDLMGIFFKDCKWRINDGRNMDVTERDKLKSDVMWLGRGRRIKGIQRFLIEDTIFKHKKKELVLEVAQVQTFDYVDKGYRDRRDKRVDDYIP